MKKLLLKLLGFCGVGGAMTLLSMLLIVLTNEIFGWHPQVSYAFAYMLTLLLSYVLNTRLVFHVPRSLKKLFGYCVAYLSGMILGMVLLKMLTQFCSGTNATLLSYVVIPITLAWNFYFVDKILNSKGEKIDV